MIYNHESTGHDTELPEGAAIATMVVAMICVFATLAAVWLVASLVA